MTPNLPPARPNVRQQPPVCARCFGVFLAGFQTANERLPEPERASDEQLRLRARARAKAVRFHKEWCCPRCTRLADADGQAIFLDAVYHERCRPARRRRKEP